MPLVSDFSAAASTMTGSVLACRHIVMPRTRPHLLIVPTLRLLFHLFLLLRHFWTLFFFECAFKVRRVHRIAYIAVAVIFHHR